MKIYLVYEKEYLFPKNLKEKHDECSRQIKIKNNEKINKAINRRYKTLKKNIYSNSKYIIMPAESFISLEDESTQQNHCIRNYAEKYAKGICDIYFMRENNNINKSLVTIEVKNSEIVEEDERADILSEVNQSIVQKADDRQETFDTSNATPKVMAEDADAIADAEQAIRNDIERERNENALSDSNDNSR